MTDKTIALTPYEQGVFTERGQHHLLTYYDGPLLEAQMCHAEGGDPVVEVIIDQRVAETDGKAVYTRFSREDLQAMLRMLEGRPTGHVADAREAKRQAARLNRHVMEALRALATQRKPRCHVQNCGTVCLCPPCHARAALALLAAGVTTTLRRERKT